jgi:superfamily I DNA and/or RNA helicase
VLNATADPALKAQGVVHVPVPHAHRSQSAPEEAQRIKQLFDSLLQQHWIDRNGATHPITPRDILVVAPYNAQVRELRRALGNQARVGTVDKFQGQEAAVAIVSMTTSDADNLPRSLDFLFNKNRLNVAVSRAKCLALVVASPGLQGMDCGTVEEMGLLSFYARLVNPDDHDLSKNNAQHDFV